jgi:hypothetical protein
MRALLTRAADYAFRRRSSNCGGRGRLIRPMRLLASAYRSPVPWQRWHFTTLSPFLTRPLPSQFLHLAFFLTFGPFSLAMMVSKVRFVRWIATEGCALSVYPREQCHSAQMV